MRRKEKEITDRAEIESIIRLARVCRLAMCDGDMPYIVPMCFGFDGDTLYFHCAPEGRKLDIIRRNPNVCFEFDVDTELIPAEESCSIGMRYRSVMGSGTASIVEDKADKAYSLDILVRQYADRSTGFPQGMLERTTVFKVEIREMRGKRSG